MTEFSESGGRSGRQVRHTVGLDLGTSSLRVQIAHYDPQGRPVGEPAAVHLPHSERDGALPTVLQLSPAGALLRYGRAAVQQLPYTPEPATPDAPRFIAEFKPCLGQAPEDLAAQGRPEKARVCTHPACSRPGWAWSLAHQFCGFCGASLAEAAARWQPQFPYPADEAREYARLLLGEVRRHLERRLNEPVSAAAGWQVVAGVPVHWQAGTRANYHQVLAQAFPEAGISLLTEPEGALRYYGCQGLVRAGAGWTLVVDFGAGTTDLVLGRIFSRGSDQLLGEVRAYGERYGGADFDLLLAQHAAAELGVELDPTRLARWKLEAQRWKEAFSDAAQYDAAAETGCAFPAPTGGPGCDFRSVVLDRPTFARIAGELVERFRSVLERGLRHFGAAGGEVTQVVLTGGGAQWYFVEAAVRELLPGARVIGGVEPVRAIARGLALAPVLPQLLEAPPRPPQPAPEPEPEPESEPSAEAGIDPGEEDPVDRSPSRLRVHGGGLRASLLQTLRIPRGRLMAAALSPDGAMVATGVEVAGLPTWGKGSITLWDANTGAERQTLPSKIPKSLAFSADATRLAALALTGTADQHSRISLLELSSGSPVWSEERKALPTAMTLSTANDLLVTTHCSPGPVSVIFWNAETGEARQVVTRDQAPDPLDVAISPDGSAVAVSCSQTGPGTRSVRVYLQGGSVLGAWLTMPDRGFSWTWAFKEPWTPVALSPDGQVLSVGSRTRTREGVSGRIYLFEWRKAGAREPSTYEALLERGAARVLDGHQDQVLQVAFTPDSRTLVSGSHDGTINLWDLETGNVRQTLTGHAKGMLALALSRAGDRMMTASSDGIVQIWSLT